MNARAMVEGADELQVDEGTKMAHVLGAKAPSIVVASFLNSWPRLLLRSGGAIGDFLQSMLNIVPQNRDDSTSRSSVWPIPRPYPETFESCSSIAMWRKKRLCLQVLMLNWFWLGEPGNCPDDLWLGRRLYRQWRIVFTLENLAEDANSVNEVDAAAMGRCAGKVELQDGEIAAIHRACEELHSYKHGGRLRGVAVHDNPGAESPALDGAYGSFSGVAPKTSDVAARPIVAGRLQFGPEPRFDPVNYLDPRTAEMYENPQAFSDYKSALPPVGRIRGCKEEVLELYRKLASSKRLVPLAADQVDPSFTSGTLCCC